MHSGQATGQSQSKMLFIPEIKSRHLQNISGKCYAIGEPKYNTFYNHHSQKYNFR